MPKNRFLNALPILLALIVTASGIGLVVLGGRSRQTPHNFAAIPAAPSNETSVPAPRQGTAPQGTNWSTIFSRWLQAATGKTPATPLQSTLVGEPSVAIDVAAIASRLPAWRLASALERDPTLPLDFQTIEVPAVAVSAGSGSAFRVPSSEFRNTLSTKARLPAPANAEDDVPELPALGEEARTAQGIAALQAAARGKQSTAFVAFLKEAGARQEAARADLAQIGLTALDEELEGARLRLDALVAPLPPDAIQLRMTNLRLQLLQNVFSTPAERDAAQLELDRLEAQWRARLREQTRARLAELRALQNAQDEADQQARSQYAAATITKNERDARTRGVVQKAHQVLIDNDFTEEDKTLGIVLPAFAPPPRASQQETTSVARQTTSVARQSTPRRAPLPALAGAVSPLAIGRLESVATKSLPGVALGGSSGGRAQVVAELRAQARREARQWSRMVARRNGWKWDEDSRNDDVITADKTSEVLAVLSFS